MRRRCAFWSGVFLIAVAAAAVPSVAIVPSYAGGSAVAGYIEDGHYFVNPSHGRPVAEVSEPTWRAAYWAELLWPFSVLVPGLTGLFLTGYGRGPNGKPPPLPPAGPPHRVLWACLLGAGVTVTGTCLFWFTVGVPWATMLVGWVLACLAAGTCAWLYSRALRRPSTADPRDTGVPSAKGVL